ncbi:MAG: hypothetical protein AABZ30_10135 [Myxococcota bacterium]
MWERLQNFDRRWIFLAMIVAIVVPLLRPVKMPFAVSERVQKLYDELESIKPGELVLLSLDYGPESAPEVDPFTQAVMRHLARKQARVVVITLWHYILPMATGHLERIYKKELGLRYGVDYAWMGFRAGNEATITNMTQSFKTVWSDDFWHTPSGKLPILDGVGALQDFRLVIDVSSGYPGAREYAQYAATRYPQIKLAAAVAMVMVTDIAPYFGKQIFSYVDGIRGAAEYEKLVGTPGLAHAGVNVLTFGHLLIIAAIVFGNVIYFATRKRQS